MSPDLLTAFADRFGVFVFAISGGVLAVRKQMDLLGVIVLGETLPPRAYAGFALLAGGLAVLDGRLLRRPRARGAAPAPKF